MRWLGPIFSLSLLVAVSACPKKNEPAVTPSASTSASTSAPSSTPTGDEAAARTHAERIRARLSSWKGYRATIASVAYPERLTRAAASPDAGPASTVPAMRMTLDVETLLPDQMRIRGEGGPQGSSITVDAHFDGARARFVIELRRPDAMNAGTTAPSVQVARADQKRLAVPGRPFDVGFNMRGFGLIEGEDLVGSLRWLLTVWHMKSVTQTVCDGRPCFRLQGTVDPDTAIDAVLARDPQLAARLGAAPNGADEAELTDRFVELIARTLQSMKHLTLDTTLEGDPVAWSFGGDAGPLFETTVQKLEIDPPLVSSSFATPAPGPNDVDVTEDVLRYRSAPAPDPARIRAVKDRLKGLFARESESSKPGNEEPGR